MGHYRHQTQLIRIPRYAQTRHPVVFAGAGPGDPDLITVKAMKALNRADVIIYAGSLVPESVLTWKGPHARTLSSADLNLVQIVDMMTAHYLDGKAVVRLHTGDPSLYGAIFEQMQALKKRDIPYQVIPGVTAAFAAAAAMTMEFTLPETTQTLILTRIPGGPRCRILKTWKAWQRIRHPWLFI